MASLTMTRRTFAKVAAATAAAAGLGAGATGTALAETDAGPEKGNEVKRIRSCCRACGKCECGVWGTVQATKVIKVEGDESNAHSRGHCCAKSQASMLALYHPDRLRYTMKRTNPKGEDDPGWVRVNFAEAMDEIGAKYNELIDKDGGKSIFSMGGTSRVWAQPPYGTLKSVFGSVLHQQLFYLLAFVFQQAVVFHQTLELSREIHICFTGPLNFDCFFADRLAAVQLPSQITYCRHRSLRIEFVSAVAQPQVTG